MYDGASPFVPGSCFPPAPLKSSLEPLSVGLFYQTLVGKAKATIPCPQDNVSALLLSQ